MLTISLNNISLQKIWSISYAHKHIHGESWAMIIPGTWYRMWTVFIFDRPFLNRVVHFMKVVIVVKTQPKRYECNLITKRRIRWDLSGTQIMSIFRHFHSKTREFENSKTVKFSKGDTETNFMATVEPRVHRFHLLRAFD